MNIHLHIDRIVLDGLNFSSADSASLESTFQRQLLALMTTNQLNHHVADSIAKPVADGGSLPLAIANDPYLFGPHLARAVHSAVTGSPTVC